MKVIFTETALNDLDEILGYLATHAPGVVGSVEMRIRAVLSQLSVWPQSARAVIQRPGIRVASIIRYPYRIFYRVTSDTIEVVHIHHTSRRPWGEET